MNFGIRPANSALAEGSTATVLKSGSTSLGASQIVDGGSFSDPLI